MQILKASMLKFKAKHPSKSKNQSVKFKSLHPSRKQSRDLKVKFAKNPRKIKFLARKRNKRPSKNLPRKDPKRYPNS
jgi:hypothetical protein